MLASIGVLLALQGGCNDVRSSTADSGVARTEATVNHRDASEAVTGGAQTSAAGGSGSGGGDGGGSAVDTAEQSSAAGDSASDESMGPADSTGAVGDSTGESSTESASTQGPQYFKPQATVLESLNQTPEVMVNLNGRQGYIPYVTEKWLYFSGYLESGAAVYRLKKEPGAELEKVIDGFLTNIGNFYFEDGMMYLLSEEVLYRWPEDEPEKVEQFDLEQAHFRFKSDAEHFIAITYSSQDVTLFDKQTLEPHTIALEPLTSGGGGAYDVASDGERIYCTRMNRPGILYVVDKATEEVKRFELAPFEQYPDSRIALGGFFVEDQKLYGNLYQLNYFGYIDTTTGTATALAAPNGWRGRTDPVLPEAGTDYVYFGASALGGNVYRYDYKRFIALPLMKEPTGLWTATGFAMDDTHVYFMSRRDPLNTGAPVGILRVRKPD